MKKILNFQFSTFNSQLQEGFTLIEIILVVAIMLILAGMAPTFYSRFLLQNAVSTTTDEMVGSLRKAQMYSMMSKTGSAWSVNFSSNTITLYKGTDFASRNSSFDEKFSINPNVSVSGITDVNFTKVTGLPTPASSTITISSSNGDSDTVTINSQGVVSK